MAGFASEAIHIQRVMQFFWMPLLIRVAVDSSVARAISQRIGVGRIRHLEVKVLWLQQLVLQGIITPVSVGTLVGTKPLPEARIHDLMRLVNMMKFTDGDIFHDMGTVRRVSSSSGLRPLLMGLISLVKLLEVEGQLVVYADRGTSRVGQAIAVLEMIDGTRWGDVIALLIILVVLIVVIAIGSISFWSGWKIARWTESLPSPPPASVWATSQTPTLSATVVNEDMMTQSPTNYKWWWAKSEFRVLHDRQHGGWQD